MGPWGRQQSGRVTVGHCGQCGSECSPHLIITHAGGIDRPLGEARAGHELLRARLPLAIHGAVVAPLPRLPSGVRTGK